MAYTTTTNIEAALGRQLTTEESAYFDTVLSVAVDSYIDGKVETSFGEVDPLTFFVSGEGTNLLIIPTVNTITAVKDEDGLTIDPSSYSVYPSRGEEKYAIKRKTGVWNEGVENYRIEATPGYKEIPGDITNVATELAVNMIYSFSSQLNSDGAKSEKVGDWSITYDAVAKSLSESATDTLSRYTRLSRRI